MNRPLTALPADLQAQLRQVLGLEADAAAVIHWEAPMTPARVIVTVWPLDASGGRPEKRYLLSRCFCWREALQFAATFEANRIHHTVVRAQDALAALLEMEEADPSEEYIRTGRPWDMATENCRRFERKLDGVPVQLPVEVAA
jgi:hypothetical protein